jgi:hypothetical protein
MRSSEKFLDKVGCIFRTKYANLKVWSVGPSYYDRNFEHNIYFTWLKFVKIWVKIKCADKKDILV